MITEIENGDGNYMNYNFLKALRNLSIDQLADIALQMAESHPETFEKLVVVGATFDFLVPYTGQKVTFTQEQLNRLRSYGRDQKVTCIKEIREITHLGLKEAKDLCEASFPNCNGQWNT